MKMFVVFCLLAGMTIFAAAKVHADTYEDQQQAQKLDDVEKQEAADDKAQYDKTHPQDSGDASIGTIIIGMIVIGAPVLYVFSKAFGKQS